MQSERERGEEVREFRLEGGTLVAVVVVLGVLLAGAFFLGGWFERRRQPDLSAAVAGGEDPLANVARAEDPIDVAEELDHFDTVEGEEKELEPSREVARPQARQAEPPPAADDGGDFYVQVWAGRDRRAAEVLIDKLQGDGYSVRLVSDRSSGEILFKVRVGGFATEERARSTASELEGKGYRGAWVTSS